MIIKGTSKNINKFYSKNNAVIVINYKYVPCNGFEVNKSFSKYDEEEVLLGCYSKFKVIQKCKNKLFNGKNVEFYMELLHINERFFVTEWF